MLHERLLDSLPLCARARDDLAQRMAEPSRHYHGMAHLDLLWSRHRRLRGAAPALSARFDRLVALAIAYHDAVFVAGANDNEERSAELWLAVSADIEGLTDDDRLWVADTIRATADHIRAAEANDLARPEGYARQWVLDLDLSPLGEDARTFDANMALLSAESVAPTEAQRQADLLAAIGHFAAARPLYRCPPIAVRFEAAAASNFARHLASVSSPNAVRA